MLSCFYCFFHVRVYYSRGQLGHGDIDSVDYPQEVQILGGVRIVQIACGGWHSCALSDSGDVYIWGWNESGQLGSPCRNLTSRPMYVCISEIEREPKSTHEMFPEASN